MNIHIINGVKKRIPGSLFFNQYVGTFDLKGTMFEFIHKAFKQRYWNHYSEGMKTLYDGLDELYKKDGYYDFGIVKLLLDSFSSPAGMTELMDLIIPYLANSKGMTDEGTYEEYGVMVKKNSIVIDAGANIGMFTSFAACYREAEVHAFEPVEFIVEILKRNIDLNNCHDRVSVNKLLGLSEKKGTAEIALSTNNIGGNTIITEMQKELGLLKKEGIRLTSIDSYVQEHQLKHVDFIKADIEGSERDMLVGAIQTLKEFKPQLAVCTYHLPDDRKVLTRIIKTANPDYIIKYGRKKLYAK